MQLPVAFLFLCLLGIVQALSTAGNRLLVVIEELADKDKYSTFWSDLESRGYSVNFESPKSEKLALFQHGERAYDHVLLLPPKSKGFGPSLTPKILMDFINGNGNILMALASDAPTPTAIVSLLLEFDIHLPSDRNALVVDHFNHDVLSASEKHDVVLVPAPKALRPGVKNFFAAQDANTPLAFPRGMGQVLGNESPLLHPVLRAPSSAYSYNPKDQSETVEDPFAVGQQLSLVSTLQARNSARFTVLGSLELLENKWFDAKVKAPGAGAEKTKTGNRDFAKALSAWTFQEIGVLKVGKVEHHLVDSTSEAEQGLVELNPKIYRIKSDVAYSIELSEYNYDHWAPFTAPADDTVQLEFSMLSPFHRLALTPSSTPTPSNSTLYTTSFTVPDQHGIFKFEVNYKRPFLTYIDETHEVTVRHYAHDEWPRSFAISGAWTWIAGIWVTVAGWLAFVAIWLWSAPVRSSGPADKAKKAQ